MKSIKKTLCLFLTILMMVSAITPVMANGDIKVRIDGEQITFDVPPQLINNRTMVPLRAIFEALGATVYWNNNTQTVTSTKGATTISLTINNPIMYVNGAAVTLDSPACLVSGRTLVPVRAISEAFGTTVDWDGANNIVNILTKQPPTPAAKEEPKQTTEKYYEGVHKVGTDIPAGSYILISDSEGYFSINADANGDNILENDNFGKNTYINLKKNTYLELSDCYAVPYSDDITFEVIDNGYMTGMYKVGKDIPAGTYKLSVISSGYYAIYDTPYGEILSNDFFYGDNYVTVKKGQYLQLSDCYVEK